MPSSETVAVIGSSGQLGTDLMAVLESSPFAPVGLTHSDIEVTDRESVRSSLADLLDLRAVINCAAFHRVDDCEEDPTDAFRINALGASHVASEAARVGVSPIFVSSDYVFDGESTEPYDESDAVAPINAYGVTKVAGEMATLAASDRGVVVRVSSLFGAAGARGKGGNFIEAILGKAKSDGVVTVIDDIVMSPTYTLDAARAIVAIVESSARGTFHACNEGTCSWFGLAEHAVRAAGVDARVERTSSDSFPSKARRPTFSAMTSERLGPEIGISQPGWEDAVDRYLLQKGYVGARSDRD